ncbi:MAG: methionine ABC transporter permease [Oscillospiraceae bacterium]
MAEYLQKFAPLLLQGTIDTLYMTLVSTFFAYVLGLPLGVLLTTTKKGAISEAPRFNGIFGSVINIMRSLPFMILMIFVIPLTRAVAGTSIGATAAIVPLVLAAAPFVARMVETSLEEVDRGVAEAAQCMGASNFQIITRVLLVESIPSLLRGVSISTITILGYTAITGAIGAGGLGDIAYRYGYQRYETEVMYLTVVLLILLVCVIQALCNYLARRLDKRNR